MQTRVGWNQRNMTFRDRDLSRVKGLSLWETFPMLASISDPALAFNLFDDFLTWDSGAGEQWVVTQAGGVGTAALTDAVGGALLLTAGHTDAGDGVQIQKVGECFKPAAGKHIWFESRLMITTNVAQIQGFVGLSVTDTTVFNAGDVSASDYIGFQVTDTGQLARAGKLDFGVNATAGAEEIEVGTYTMITNTFVNLGFFVNGITSITAYVNGVAYATIDTVANIPVTEMTPTFVCQSNGTANPTMTIDWFRCAQLR